MNPLLWTSVFSFKTELKLLGAVVATAVLLPVFAVIILTQAGFSIISGVLATTNIQTHQVDLHDPATGAITGSVRGPFEWPVTGVVTLEFGQPDPPYEEYHTGIDIGGPLGTPITSFMAGTVTYAGTTATEYGTHVILDNGQGITSLYGHMESLNVTVGQKVDIGTVLGLRGDTGWSTGPHLHFQIDIDGIPVDPRTFLEGDPSAS